jgi:hypothetical protein
MICLLVAAFIVGIAVGWCLALASMRGPKP